MVPDFYAMLGISPDANRSTIESALARCQPIWSSGTRNPKTKHTHQSYLDLIPTIRPTLLGDPAGRAAYDSELRAAAAADRDKKLDSLQKLIKLRAAKGGLTVADMSLLRDETAKLGLAPEDLYKLTEPIPPKPESPTSDDTPDPAVETVDPVMRKQILVALSHLRKRSLYDALDLPRDASIREIASRADGERQRWMKKTQVTAEKTAWLEVVTLAQSHLTTPASRARYDQMLTLEAEENFKTAIHFALKGIANLDPNTKATLLEEASSLGILPDRAERLINRACGTLRVARSGNNEVPIEALIAPTRYLRCRVCHGLSNHAEVAKKSNTPSCKHCSQSLEWSCPVCKRTMWVDEPRCACGFLLEYREPLIQHLDAAIQAYKHKQFSASLLHFRRVQAFAPSHAGARKGIVAVNKRLAEIDTQRSEYEIARAARKLAAARNHARAWARLTDLEDPDRKAAWAEVNQAIAEALRLAARGKSREASDPKSARDFYRKSLAIAVDLPEAIEGLKRTPPDPPSDLTAVYVENRVKLNWSPPPSDGFGPVTYVVLRKPELAFKHPRDGMRIGEASGPTFEDPEVIPGTSVSYAVLSKRNGIESVGAVAVGPIYILGEVRDVRVDVRSKEIDLFWIPPPNAIEVRVTRKRGSPPLTPLDGDRVEALLDQAHDRGLESERVYHYGIYVIYRTPDGRATASLGKNVSAQPHTPVHPVAAPTIESYRDGKILLRWIEPNRGIVKLLRTLQPIGKEPGERLSPAQVAGLQGDWIEVDTFDHTVDKPPPVALCYYTPLTTWGGNTTVGHSAIFSRVADPTDLQVTRLSAGKLQFRWDWEPTSSQSIVVMKSGSPPTSPEDPDAVSETVDQTDYVARGHHPAALPNGRSGPWHFAVFARAFIDGEPVASPGLDPSARLMIPGPEVDVVATYAFTRRRILGGRWWITFKTEPVGEQIPPTVLITNPRAVPFAADDGMIAADFPASKDGARYKLPRGLNPFRVHARLFLDPRVEPTAMSAIKIRHPETDATRV